MRWTCISRSDASVTLTRRGPPARTITVHVEACEDVATRRWTRSNRGVKDLVASAHAVLRRGAFLARIDLLLV
jgi:hypothetical protein